MMMMIKTLWQMKSVKINPAVTGALGTVSNNLNKHLKQISSTITMEAIQKYCVSRNNPNPQVASPSGQKLQQQCCVTSE